MWQTASHLKKTSKLFLKFRLIRNIFLIIRFFFFFFFDSEKY